ncbi:MAG: SH3 domain-containing protein [Chloroflexi bacterium]|nr:SH3 domain-containing protein [Chloroflexota bacterium]MBP8057914.1 SH3 domain-containing protein [Chloroflexota bacterium]
MGIFSDDSLLMGVAPLLYTSLIRESLAPVVANVAHKGSLRPRLLATTHLPKVITMRKYAIPFPLLVAIFVLLVWGTPGSFVAAAPSAIPLHQSSATATIGTGALNVRSGPGLGYGVVTVCYQGQAVTMIGRNNNNSWVKIRLATGHEGWVSAPYIIPTVAIASLPLADGSTTPPPSTTASGTVATGALNVRSGPGVGYGILTSVYQGASFTLLGRNADGSWVKIRLSNGTEGWANASLITANVAIANLTVLDNSTPGTTASGTVATGALNVRYGPGVSYGVITAIHQGTYVTLLGRNSNSTWAKIRLGSGTEGWVNASLVTANVVVSSLPVLEGGTGTTPPPAAGGVTATVTTAANVRSGPGTGYYTLSGVYPGQVLALLGRNHTSEWVQVRLADGTTGWIYAWLVTLSVPLNGLPITG